MRSTLLLGVVWAVWHLPLLFASDGAAHGLTGAGLLGLIALTLVSIVGYAFAYTYVFNRTGSVLLCIVMHAGFNTALSSAALRTEAALQGADYALVLGLTALTTWVGVGVLVALTRGRLGTAVGAPLDQGVTTAGRAPRSRAIRSLRSSAAS